MLHVQLGGVVKRNREQCYLNAKGEYEESINEVAYESLSTVHTLCLKKVPTFKLSVTLSNRNGFSKFLHC